MWARERMLATAAVPKIPTSRRYQTVKILVYLKENAQTSAGAFMGAPVPDFGRVELDWSTGALEQQGVGSDPQGKTALFICPGF